MPSWSPDDKEIALCLVARGPAGCLGGQRRRPARSAKSARVDRGRVDAPSWGPDGERRLSRDDRRRPRRLGRRAGNIELPARRPDHHRQRERLRVPRLMGVADDFYYVSDGKIRKRDARRRPPADRRVLRDAAGDARGRQLHAQAARLHLDRPAPGARHRARRLSPDGKQIAFAALGDIYVMPVGGKPVNLTKDAALDTEPAWSPDGSQLAYSSDKDSEHLQLWIRDMKSGRSRRLTDLTTQPQGAAWSPDGTRIAFFNVDGMWRVAQMSVIDVASGKVTKVHDSLPQPGAPAWSPDGKRLAIAGIAPMTKRFREGTNQILTMSSTALNDDKWFAPQPLMSIDSRGGCGPAWSPDGTKMAAIYEGVLAVWPVSPAGEPLGPPRARDQRERALAELERRLAAHPLSVARQAADRRRRERRDIRTVPLDLKYTPSIPTTRLVVHAGRLVDMKSAAARHQRRHRHRGQQDHQRRAARRGEPHRPGRRRVEPVGDARAHRVPLAPAAGLRRIGGPRLAGVRHHHGAESRQHAVRAGRGARGERGERPNRAARLRHRQPDGVAARVLQDGDRDLQRRPLRDGTAARQGAAVRPAQELRAPARPAAEADGRVRPQHRRPGGDARDLSRPRSSAPTIPSTPPPPAAAATRRRWRRCSAPTRT